MGEVLAAILHNGVIIRPFVFVFDPEFDFTGALV